MTNRIGAGGNVHRLHTQVPMAAAVNDHRTAQSSRFRVHRPVGLGAEVEVYSRRGEKDSAYAELCISISQLLQRRFGIMHWQNTDAFEARIPSQVSFCEPVVVSPSGPRGIVPVDDASDALPGGGKQDGIVEPYLIQELNPSFRSGIVKATVGAHTKRARRGLGE